MIGKMERKKNILIVIYRTKTRIQLINSKTLAYQKKINLKNKNAF